MADLSFNLTARQSTAFKFLLDKITKRLLYGGSKGGGKSFLFCVWAFYWSNYLADFFKLKISKEPPPIGFLGRRRAGDFNKTTLETWKKIIPANQYELKTHTGELILFGGKCKLFYGGLDDQKAINKFNSAELCFFALDQAEEITRDAIGELRASLRFSINGKAPIYKELYTANPSECWLKEDFINKSTRAEGSVYVPALPTDNKYLPAGYVDRLKEVFKYNKALLRAYLYGEWDGLSAGKAIIPRDNVELNVCNKQYNEHVIKKITVCDIADEGNDETVIYDLTNTRIESQEIYRHVNTMDTCGRLQSHARKHGSNMIALDICGMGKPVYDRLNEVFADDKSIMSYGYDGRVSADDDLTYGNKKCESWFYAAGLFADRRCDIPNDPELIKQLAGVEHRFGSNGKLFCERKDKIREVLSCSPDRAETYIMGLDALRFAVPVKKVDRYMRESEEAEEYYFTPETC